MIILQVTTALYVKIASSESAVNENMSLPGEDAKRTFTPEIQDPNVNRRRRTMANLSGSRKITMIYCVIIFVAAVVWLILASKSHSSLSSENSKADSSAFIHKPKILRSEEFHFVRTAPEVTLRKLECFWFFLEPHILCQGLVNIPELVTETLFRVTSN